MVVKGDSSFACVVALEELVASNSDFDVAGYNVEAVFGVLGNVACRGTIDEDSMSIAVLFRLRVALYGERPLVGVRATMLLRVVG